MASLGRHATAPLRNGHALAIAASHEANRIHLRNVTDGEQTGQLRFLGLAYSRDSDTNANPLGRC